MQTGSTPKHGPKTRLLTLDHIDGRTRAAQRVRDLLDGIESDLGGSEHGSTLCFPLGRPAPGRFPPADIGSSPDVTRHTLCADLIFYHKQDDLA
jgi:hypothetical protein